MGTSTRTIVCTRCSNAFEGHWARKFCDACRKPARNEYYDGWLKKNRGTTRRREWGKNYNIRRRMQQLGAEALDFEETLEEQKHCCPICLRAFVYDGSDHARRPCIDHCHRDNEFRGILCMTCNRALGMLGDDEASLRRALEYLQASKIRQHRIYSRSTA